MYFDGDPVTVIGEINPDDLKKLGDIIKESFENKWIKRSLHLMEDCYCLKALTPSNIDLPDLDTQEELKTLLMPFVEPYIKSNEILLYLDVSCVPPGKRTKVHIDHALMHHLSRRLHIPIITNSAVRFAVLHLANIKNFHMQVGKVYEVNNQVMHIAANLGTEPRWHMIIDIIDKEIYDYLVKSNKLLSKTIDPSINYITSTQVIDKLNKVVESEITND
jgi:hypothetical protein